jgi:hypothetical protein
VVNPLLTAASDDDEGVTFGDDVKNRRGCTVARAGGRHGVAAVVMLSRSLGHGCATIVCGQPLRTGARSRPRATIAMIGLAQTPPAASAARHLEPIDARPVPVVAAASASGGMTCRGTSRPLPRWPGCSSAPSKISWRLSRIGCRRGAFPTPTVFAMTATSRISSPMTSCAQRTARAFAPCCTRRSPSDSRSTASIVSFPIPASSSWTPRLSRTGRLSRASRTPDGVMDTSVAARFYADIQATFDGQILIMENMDPPDGLEADSVDVPFTKSLTNGRYGFFPYRDCASQEPGR